MENVPGNGTLRNQRIETQLAPGMVTIITYAEGTITWKSQLQAEVALSSTEPEYTGLSYGLRKTIPSVELLKGVNRIKHDHSEGTQTSKSHHYRSYVEVNRISIHPIGNTITW